jgi:lipopolysaccharide export LptBFGC system permease protein LptF
MATLWPPYFEIAGERKTHSFLAFGSLKEIKGLNDLKTQYASGEMHKFEEELLETYLTERGQIADHARRVSLYLFIGTHFFVVAFFCFIGLAATLFLPNEVHALRACLIGFIIFAIFLGVGNYLRSKSWSRLMMIVWIAVTALSALGLTLSWILR